MIKYLKYVLTLVVLFQSCIDKKSEVIIEKQQQKSSVNGKWAYQMVDPALDDPAKPWSYSSKPTVVIGVPFSPAPVQITYDGTIYTGKAELAFFYGDSLNAVMARQRNFIKGWIPIVQNKWKDKGLLYETEIFGANVEGMDSLNSLQFVKITVGNISNQPQRAVIEAASRTSGLDHRYRGAEPCLPETRYEMGNNCFFRDGLLIYNFQSGGKPYAVPDVDYKTPFLASDYQITQRTEVGLTKYNSTLKPNEKVSWIFKMPRVPIKVGDSKSIEAIKQANYEEYREKTIKFWENLIDNKVRFNIPEARINFAYRASMVHLILATRNQDGRKRQGSGLPYDGLFLNDYADMRLAYDFMKLPEFVDVNVSWLMEQQTKDGMFVDKSLSHGKEILASHGQALYSLAHHYIMTQNKEYAKNVYESIKKGVNWIKEEHERDKYGLLRTSTPYDNEMIKGHYTSHNLWAILALRSAISVARSLGEKEDIANWTALHQSYLSSILKAIKKSVREDNYLPPGLYDYEVGEEARTGFKKYRTDQDWENMLLLYPSEVLTPKDSIVIGTLEHIRKNKYREGIMTYRNGMHLHQYITYNLAQQYMAAGYYKRALTDFYHIMLHNGSVHEGFENLVEPWEDRDPDPSPTPHAWAAAKTVVFTRNMLVREFGGSAGLNPSKRDLYLFSLLSPEWVKDGKSVSFSNAPTEMGDISSTMTFKGNSAKVTINSKFHAQPHFICVPIPYFKELVDFESNAKTSYVKNKILYFSPEVTEITINWKDNNMKNVNNYQELLRSYRSEPNIKWKGFEAWGNPKPAVQMMDEKDNELFVVEPQEGFILPDEESYPAEYLSFELVKKAFQKEYQRRADDYLDSGKKFKPIKPVVMLVKERKRKMDSKN